MTPSDHAFANRAIHEGTGVVERPELAHILIPVKVCIKVHEGDVVLPVDIDDTAECPIRHRMVAADDEWEPVPRRNFTGDAANLLKSHCLIVGIHAGVAVVDGIQDGEGGN